MASTFENWKSEFLQLFTMVVLVSFLIHRGSQESKDSDAELRAGAGGDRGAALPHGKTPAEGEKPGEGGPMNSDTPKELAAVREERWQTVERELLAEMRRRAPGQALYWLTVVGLLRPLPAPAGNRPRLTPGGQSGSSYGTSVVTRSSSPLGRTRWSAG